jgi:NAD(P)H-hydrate epimerase
MVNRFVSPQIAEKYDIDVPDYDGLDQVVEIGADGSRL